VVLFVVCADHSKSRLQTIKYHRLLHGSTSVLLFGRQDCITAGLYDALHRNAAKDLFQLQTNKHHNCLGTIAVKVSAFPGSSNCNCAINALCL
jgi:hypothetical protein